MDDLAAAAAELPPPLTVTVTRPFNSGDEDVDDPGESDVDDVEETRLCPAVVLAVAESADAAAAAAADARMSLRIVLVALFALLLEAAAREAALTRLPPVDNYSACPVALTSYCKLFVHL